MNYIENDIKTRENHITITPENIPGILLKLSCLIKVAKIIFVGSPNQVTTRLQFLISLQG